MLRVRLCASINPKFDADLLRVMQYNVVLTEPESLHFFTLIHFKVKGYFEILNARCNPAIFFLPVTSGLYIYCLSNNPYKHPFSVHFSFCAFRKKLKKYEKRFFCIIHCATIGGNKAFVHFIEFFSYPTIKRKVGVSNAVWPTMQFAISNPSLHYMHIFREVNERDCLKKLNFVQRGPNICKSAYQ